LRRHPPEVEVEAEADADIKDGPETQLEAEARMQVVVDDGEVDLADAGAAQTHPLAGSSR
jgi:hypothetical protein